VAFHPNNRHLFSVSWDTTARMWDFKTGAEVKRFTHAKDVNGLALTRGRRPVIDRQRRRESLPVERCYRRQDSPIHRPFQLCLRRRLFAGRALCRIRRRR